MVFFNKISYLRLLLCLCCWSSVVKGTTFLEVPLEIQVRNAEGVVWGKFKSKSTKKISGTIVTEATFELLAVSGIEPSEIANKKDNFKIIYPGGNWQGITYKVLGAPDFEKGEEVLLFVGKERYGFGLVNLALSKYSVERRKEEIFFKNSVFPSHHSLGKISLGHLNTLLEERFQHPFVRVVQDKYPYPKGRLNKRYVRKGGKTLEERKPASLDSFDKGTKKQKSYEGMVWIILIFTIFGGFLIMAQRSE